MQWGYKNVPNKIEIVDVVLPLKCSKYLSSSACYTNLDGNADICVKPNSSNGTSIRIVIDNGKENDWSFTWIAFTLA